MAWADASRVVGAGVAAGLALSGLLVALALSAPGAQPAQEPAPVEEPAPPPAPAPAPAPAAALVSEATPPAAPAPVPAAQEEAPHADADPSAALRGRVVDQDGNPVEGADVRLEGPGQGELAEDLSDEAGAFALGQRQGSARLRVSAEGFQARELEVELPAEVAVSLTALGVLEVSVLGDDGVLSDAEVEVEAAEARHGYTNDEGVAEFAVVPGLYRVRARHPGFRARPSVEVELRPGERVPLDISLERAAPGEEAVVDGRDRAPEPEPEDDAPPEPVE